MYARVHISVHACVEYVCMLVCVKCMHVREWCWCCMTKTPLILSAVVSQGMCTVSGYLASIAMVPSCSDWTPSLLCVCAHAPVVLSCLWSVANSLASFDMKMTFIEMKYEMISKYEIGN